MTLEEELKELKSKKKELEDKYMHQIELGDNFKKRVNEVDVSKDKKLTALSKYRSDNPIYDEYRKIRFDIRILEHEIEETKKR